MIKIEAEKNIYENCSPKFLDTKDRPQELIEIIDRSFDKLKYNVQSEWGCFNGDAEYNLCGISEFKLLEKVIENNPNRKNFYFLDVGAGNFQLINSIAKKINSKNSLKGEQILHVVGIRGEGGDQVIKEIGKCKVYELTAFKIECIFESFQKKGLKFEKKFDVIASNWSVRHFADSLGFFVDVHNKYLRPCTEKSPRTGYLVMDGFFFFLNKNTDPVFGNSLIQYMLKNTHEPFLIKEYKENRSLDQFILQRTNEQPLQLPWTYAGVDYENTYYEDWQIGSSAITKFKSIRNTNLVEKSEISEVDKKNESYEVVDKKRQLSTQLKHKHLYDWLVEEKLFVGGQFDHLTEEEKQKIIDKVLKEIDSENK